MRRLRSTLRLFWRQTSRSIDDGEFVLERLFYAETIQSQKLLDAISIGAHGAIALAYLKWTEKANRCSSSIGRPSGMRRGCSSSDPRAAAVRTNDL